MNTTEAEKDWLRRISGQKPSEIVENHAKRQPIIQNA